MSFFFFLSLASCNFGVYSPLPDDFGSVSVYEERGHGKEPDQASFLDTSSGFGRSD